MIHLIDAGGLRLPECSEAAIRIAAMAQTYGTAPFWRVYAGDGGSVCAVMGDTAVLCPGEDREDMALFLAMSPDIGRVRTDAQTAKRLGERGLWQIRTGMVMRQAEIPPGIADTVVPLTPAEAYPLLRTVFEGRLPPWDVWYADVFYRMRRGRCRIVGVRREGEVLSVAMTVAETAQNWLLGGVATREDRRGQGLASACVTALCRQAEKESRPVWLAPGDAAARRLYGTLGFVPCGTWGEAARGGASRGDGRLRVQPSRQNGERSAGLFV